MRAVHGFELLSQASYRYGATRTLGTLGGSVFPVAAVVPPNPEPEPVTLDDLRGVVMEAMAQARAADEALAMIDGDFDLRADVLLVRMDMDGDGVAGENESVVGLLDGARVRIRGGEGGTVRALPVDFDRGDAEWLRGYCNLAMALGEFVLAHDAGLLFERAGHVLFPKNETAHGYLKEGRSPFADERAYTGGIEPLDIVAMVHLMRFPVREPDRMERARAHLLAAVGHSRAMWTHYDAETDDRDEWVPNPRQSAAFPGAVVDEDMRGVWKRFLDDAESLLEGRVLLPFWRGDGERGVNVRRVFAEPREFDLILWLQGSAAAPYLEEGEQLDLSVWEDLERVFDQRTFRHMFWLN
jgi:hypothetical protein